MATNFWSASLIKSTNDIKNHIISSNSAVVIHDMYPKAQQHYLVLPKQDISTIFDLGKEHLSLLEELHLLALNTIEVKGQKLKHFKIGFHAEPSMQHLHLHVISKDFVSDYLKTKKHWNSFNTRYFRPYEDLYDELIEKGCIQRWHKDEIQSLIAAQLTCNQCDFIAKNMPNLKEHLVNHWQKNKIHE